MLAPPGGIEPHAVHPTLRIGLEDRCRARRLILAERVGFEPTVHVATYDGLATRCLRPLSHRSIH